MRELDEFISELKYLGVSNEIIGKALIKTATKYVTSIEDMLQNIDERLGRVDHTST